jgi:hypothetical protein
VPELARALTTDIGGTGAERTHGAIVRAGLLLARYPSLSTPRSTSDAQRPGTRSGRHARYCQRTVQAQSGRLQHPKC